MDLSILRLRLDQTDALGESVHVRIDGDDLPIGVNGGKYDIGGFVTHTRQFCQPLLSNPPRQFQYLPECTIEFIKDLLRYGLYSLRLDIVQTPFLYCPFNHPDVRIRKHRGVDMKLPGEALVCPYAIDIGGIL